MVCNMYRDIHVHAFLYLYVHCTYIVCIDVTVNTCQTLPVFGQCTYMSVQLTTTLQVHFPLLGLISLATPASLSSAQEQLLLSSLLPGTSLFNRQTTQVLLATPKLPQPLVHLIHIAATPVISCCNVTAVHREARPLVLVLLLRNGRLGVELPARKKGISGTLPTMLRQLVKTCMYLAYMCTFSVYTCTYSVHGYHILYAYTTTVFAQ